jgi:hypothetical protein
MSDPKTLAAIELATLLNAANSEVAIAVERCAGMSAQTFRLLESIVAWPEKPMKHHIGSLGLAKPPGTTYALQQLLKHCYIAHYDGPLTGPRDRRTAYYRATSDGIKFVQKTRRHAASAICEALDGPRIQALTAALTARRAHA